MKQPYLAKLRFLLFLLLGLAGSIGAAWAQAGGTVTGRVTDAKNEGIPGVTVVIEGSTLGGSTDIEGNYTIANVPAGPHTVVISFVGYTTLRQPITVVAGQATTVAKQQLAENATALGEAVVVGYGTQRKQDVTGALTTVTSKEFVQGQITNPEQLVQGKVAGVQITTGGGAPGAATTIRIRGGSSLNASNDPLIVIDGVPVDNSNASGVSNPLSLINPNDIETFTVLKDASATAIYGSRASNGVILITTKRGIIGEKLTVTVSSNASVARRYNAVPVLSADEFRAAVQRVDPAKTGLLGTANTNWQDQIFRSAYSLDNNVSVAGAVGKLPFRASIGNLEQQGILITNRLVRNTGSLSLNPVLFDNHLRVNLNVKGSWIDNNFADAGAIGAAAAFDPTQPVNSGSSAYGGYFEYLQSAGGVPQLNVPRNPVALLELRRDRSSVKRSIGNLQLDYKLHFLPDLHANVNIGYDITRAGGTNFIDPSSAGTYVNTPRYVNPLTTNLRGGVSSQYAQQRDNKLLELYLNYSKQFGTNSRLEVLGGYSYQDFVRREPAYATYLGTSPDTVVRIVANTNPFRTQYTILSYYGRANLTLFDRYIFTGTLRNDRSSRFSGDNRSALFPAASFAWRIKDEAFLKENKVLSDLKLRLGYGITGQQDVANAGGATGDYPYIQRYTLNVPNAQYIFGTVPIQPYSPLGFNRNIKWEQTTTYNAGLDLGFLDGRLTASADVYYRKTKDLLAVIPIALGINNTNQLISNVGTLENKGIELNIAASLIKQEGFDWTVNLNGTYNVNRITSLGPQVESFTGIRNNNGGNVSGGTGTQLFNYQVGNQATSYYVYQQVYGANGKPLDDVYVDRNGDGIINDNDRYQYQQAAPKVLLGFSSNLNYKHVFASFSMRSNLGNYVYNNINSNYGTYQGINGSTNFLGNVAQNAQYTNFALNTQNKYASDYYIQNASFLRMDNATIGYNVGKVFTSKANLRITGAVQNVFVITKYTGLDPEIPNGIDNNVYPRPRTYTLGLNLTL